MILRKVIDPIYSTGYSLLQHLYLYARQISIDAKFQRNLPAEYVICNSIIFTVKLTNLKQYKLCWRYNFKTESSVTVIYWSHGTYSQILFHYCGRVLIISFSSIFCSFSIIYYSTSYKCHLLIHKLIGTQVKPSPVPCFKPL